MTPLKPYDFSGHSFERIPGIDHQQEQQACCTAERFSTSPADAQLLYDILGIHPDKKHMETIKKKRKKA